MLLLSFIQTYLFREMWFTHMSRMLISIFL